MEKNYETVAGHLPESTDEDSSSDPSKNLIIVPYETMALPNKILYCSPVIKWLLRDESKLFKTLQPIFAACEHGSRNVASSNDVIHTVTFFPLIFDDFPIDQ